MRTNLLIGVTLFVLLGTASYADEGAALYKTRCAACHGATGEGKPAMKAPTIKGTKLDVNQLVDHLSKGEAASRPPHNKAMPGLKEDQAKAIAAYVKTL